MSAAGPVFDRGDAIFRDPDVIMDLIKRRAANIFYVFSHGSLIPGDKGTFRLDERNMSAAIQFGARGYIGNYEIIKGGDHMFKLMRDYIDYAFAWFLGLCGTDLKEMPPLIQSLHYGTPGNILPNKKLEFSEEDAESKSELWGVYKATDDGHLVKDDSLTNIFYGDGTTTENVVNLIGTKYNYKTKTTGQPNIIIFVSCANASKSEKAESYIPIVTSFLTQSFFSVVDRKRKYDPFCDPPGIKVEPLRKPTNSARHPRPIVFSSNPDAKTDGDWSAEELEELLLELADESDLPEERITLQIVTSKSIAKISGFFEALSSKFKSKMTNFPFLFFAEVAKVGGKGKRERKRTMRRRSLKHNATRRLRLK